jgi:hypothetical protein
MANMVFAGLTMTREQWVLLGKLLFPNDYPESVACFCARCGHKTYPGEKIPEVCSFCKVEAQMQAHEDRNIIVASGAWHYALPYYVPSKL